MSSTQTTPVRSASGNGAQPQTPATVPRPDAVQVPPSPGAAAPEFLKYTGASIPSVSVGKLSVYAGLEGDIKDYGVISEEDGLAAIAEAESKPMPDQPFTNDDSIYGVPPAAAAPAAPQGGKRRARTGRKHFLSGPRRTARNRASLRNRRSTRPQLI